MQFNEQTFLLSLWIKCNFHLMKEKAVAAAALRSGSVPSANC